MAFPSRTLGSICDEVGGIIQTGPFGSQLHEADYRVDGVPMIMPKNIIDGRVSVDDIARIGDEDIARLSRHLLKKGDIVYGRRGDIGRRALITEREDGWLCGTGCLRISLGDAVVDPTFLYYYLGKADVIAWIANQAVGATLPNLNTSIIRSISVAYPPLPVQRKIAAILSAYDDLIANNMRRIALLEAMAQALYREWFVHFRFPGHAGVRMIDSPLGPIPAGCGVVAFTDIADVLSGGTPRTEVPEYWDGDIPFFTPRDITSSFYVIDTERRITAQGLKRCNSQLYPKDTVFITARGTVGRIAMPATGMAMSQTSYALLGRVGISQFFVFLTTQNVVARLKQKATGAVFDTIVVDTFRMLEVLRPPNQLLGEFTKLVTPIFDQVLNLQSKNINLRRTRDLLLPRLVAGAVDVAGLDVELSSSHGKRSP